MENKRQYQREDLQNLRVAVIHYWLVTWRGGEKVVESILKLFPQADVYTLFYDPEVCGSYLQGHEVYTSVLDRPFLRKKYQKLFPLYPTGIRSLTLKKKYDLVISSESGPAKGVFVPQDTPHLCYIHSPMRYCWGYTNAYLETLPAWSRRAAAYLFERLRKWDETTIDNVNHYVANSENIANRVKRFYNRNASVCYPPIALELFQNEFLTRRLEHQTQFKDEGYYLSFGAITPYKNIDLLVDCFNQSGKTLLVIGEGSEKAKLEKRAKSNIQFLGRLPWSQIEEKILGARALLFPGEEDFGMIPLEAMAHGVPIIALGKGGALESVVEDKSNPATSSGLFFAEETKEQLLEAIQNFEEIEDQFDPMWIQSHARKFGEDHFQENMSQEIIQFLCSHSSPRTDNR